MNCRKAQELIISGYSDNELKFFWKKELEAHLGLCAECREFLTVFKTTVVTPFKEEPVLNAPDYLWYRIKDKITAAKPPAAKHNIFDVFIKMPRPVFAVFTVIILIAVNFLVVGTMHVNHGDKSSAAVLAYLEEPGTAGVDDTADIGGDIEKAFL